MDDQTNDNAQNAAGQPPPPPPPAQPQAAAPPPMQQEVNLDGSTGSLVCGIIGVCTTCLFVGWILGIIAIVLNRKAMKHMRTVENTGVKITGKGNATAGLVMGIIATVSGLFWIMYYFILGAAIIGGIGAMSQLEGFQ